ncbi:MAG TPA: hypothetical protein VGA38_12975 [Candidatus Limnocylindria bacterium]
MRTDRLIALAFVVLVSTAIVGFSAGSTSASFTASTTNPSQSTATSNVAAPASASATSAAAGVVNLSWPATTTPANGHTVTYLILRNGTQIASTAALTYSDTPAADGTYSYTVQTKIAQGAGFFTSGSSPAASGVSDATAPTAATGITTAKGTSAGQINLTWTAGTDALSGVAGYTIHRSGVVASCAATNTTNYPNATAVGAVTSATISGLVSASKYCFYLTTNDNAGNASANSAAAGPQAAK